MTYQTYDIWYTCMSIKGNMFGTMARIEAVSKEDAIMRLVDEIPDARILSVVLAK